MEEGYYFPHLKLSSNSSQSQVTFPHPHLSPQKFVCVLTLAFVLELHSPVHKANRCASQQRKEINPERALFISTITCFLWSAPICFCQVQLQFMDSRIEMDVKNRLHIFLSIISSSKHRKTCQIYFYFSSSFIFLILPSLQLFVL